MNHKLAALEEVLRELTNSGEPSAEAFFLDGLSAVVEVVLAYPNPDVSPVPKLQQVSDRGHRFPPVALLANDRAADEASVEDSDPGGALDLLEVLQHPDEDVRVRSKD
ncbi:MAG: hypothetical protein ACRDJF_08990 [Actinomycetota bacterium]